jgi:hypothetical protein
MFVVRRVWIVFGSMHFIIESFQASNTYMTLSEKSFLMFLSPHEYLWRNRRLWTSWLTIRGKIYIGRPLFVLVYGWTWGKHAWVDLTRVSPLVGLMTENFTIWQATLKVASSKVPKHERTCYNNQHDFLALDVVNILKKLQRFMHNNVISSRSLDIVFKRICFSIKKISDELIIRLSFIQV